MQYQTTMMFEGAMPKRSSSRRRKQKAEMGGYEVGRSSKVEVLVSMAKRRKGLGACGDNLAQHAMSITAHNRIVRDFHAGGQ